jgi:nucleoid-associated protein YgaU
MSGHRLLGTTAAMAGIAAVLALLTPALPELARAVLAAQRTADTAGLEALLVAVAGLLAWAVWAWGALGLVLTAASAVPGAIGSATGLLARVLLPAGARRGAALALGLGLGVAGPVAGSTLLVLAAPAASAGTTSAPVPDWPEALQPTDRAPVPGAGELPARPDAPAPGAPGDHVVVRGDCLWDIAAANLADRLGRAPTDAETAGATSAWWSANAAVIGPDPDVLLPGQVLRPPP